MPFAFNQLEPTNAGQVEQYDVPINRWLGLKFESGSSMTVGRAVSEFTEDVIYDDGNTINNLDTLNKVWGIPGHLTFDKPVSIQRARLINERKQREIEMQAQLEAASHSALSARGALGFGAELIGGISHPLDFGTMFLGFVGSEAKAANVARIGGNKLEQAMARGLITEEAIGAAKIPFP